MSVLRPKSSISWRRLCAVLAVPLLALGACSLLRPSIETSAQLGHPAQSASGLSATFYGVSTVRFDDGPESLLIDGFFNRPGLLELALGKIGSDKTTIDRTVRDYGLSNVKAVLVAHSHVDHGFDSAAIASATGATLVGSPSVLNVFPPRDMTPYPTLMLSDGRQIEGFGAFHITAFRTPHSPKELFPGPIAAPVQLPAHVSKLHGGENYSFLIVHKETRILVVPGAHPADFGGVKADIVILSVGGLGREDEGFAEKYWRCAVTNVGARRVVLVHWDDFTHALDKPLIAMPWPADKVGTGIERMIYRAGRDGVDVQIPGKGERIDLSHNWTRAAAGPRKMAYLENCGG